MRSQVVILWHRLGSGEDWVQIESPFGDVDKVILRAAVEAVGNTGCGGMAMFSDVVTFRHSVPLDYLQINDFESPSAGHRHGPPARAAVHRRRPF